MIRARIDRIHRTGDAGVSLVELLVTLVVGAIVLAIVGSFFTSSVRTTTSSNQSRITTGMTVNAENSLTNSVRVIAQTTLNDGTTPYIVSAGPTSFTYYSYGNTAVADMRQSKFTVTVTDQKRIQVTQCVGSFNGAYWSFPCSPTTTTVITYPGVVVDPVATNAELPLFSYFDTNRARIGAGQASLTTTQIAGIASIGVSVKLKTSATATDASALYITNTVGMPNIALIQSGDDGS